MKIRQQPEDFQVEELATVRPTGGPYALYRLTKRSLTTPDAVDRVLQAFNLPRQTASYGGLKDRHAITVQYLTVRGGPARSVAQNLVKAEFLGAVDQPFKPAMIEGNRFEVVMRDLSMADLKAASAAAKEARLDGLPNYFDDQRFGSMSAGGEFIARAWIDGDYERALWLVFAEPYPHDPAGEARERATLREHWGKWDRCKAMLARSHRRSIVTYLCDHPTDFRNAWALHRPDMRSLYLAAYQSALWNRMLSALIEARLPAASLRPVPLRIGPMAFFGPLTDAQRAGLVDETLPLPSARLHLDADHAVRPLLDRVLAQDGITLEKLKVKHPRDVYFARSWRRAIVPVTDLTTRARPDELQPGRQALSLRFTLGRGSYATLLVKRLTVAAGIEAAQEPAAEDIESSSEPAESS